MRFEDFHPLISLIYFTGAAVSICAFDHPAYILISWAAVFAGTVVIRGRKGAVTGIVLMPLALLWTVIYASYNHFGVTCLMEGPGGSSITLEALATGLSLGARGASAIMLISSFLHVFSSDKVVYLTGRIWPRLSLFISAALRIPSLAVKGASSAAMARRGLGKGPGQGDAVKRMRNTSAMLSALITKITELPAREASSMKCRGYSLKGRTAFSIYRFDNRDRVMVVVMTALIVVTAAAFCLDQTSIYYDPEIVMNKVTGMSFAFYGAHLLFMIIPAVSEAFYRRVFTETMRSN